MKKLTHNTISIFLSATIVIVCTYSNINAQEELMPIPLENSIWINGHYTLNTDNPDFFFLELDGYEKFCANGEDTIINNVDYKMIHICDGDYKGALRNEEGKVFYVPGATNSEYLLYDFTATEGDTIDNVYFEGIFSGEGTTTSYVVNEVNSIQINGSTRKMIYLEGAEWIEGVGNTMGLFKESSLNVSNYDLQLECMSSNDTVQYSNENASFCDLLLTIENDEISFVSEDKIKVYPTVSSGRINIKSNAEGLLFMYTIDGKMIDKIYVQVGSNLKDYSSLKKGIYFLRGKLGVEEVNRRIVLQ